MDRHPHQGACRQRLPWRWRGRRCPALRTDPTQGAMVEVCLLTWVQAAGGGPSRRHTLRAGPIAGGANVCPKVRAGRSPRTRTRHRGRQRHTEHHDCHHTGPSAHALSRHPHDTSPKPYGWSLPDLSRRGRISPDRPVYASFVAPKRRYGAEKQCNTRCCDQIAADDSIIRQTPGPGSSHPRCRLASGQATNPGVQMMAAAGGPRGQWERRASATRQACAGAGSGPASGCGVTASTATAPGGAIMGKHKGQCRDADELGASLSLTSTHFIPVAPHASVDACGETMGAATDAPTNKTNHSNTQRASNLWLRSLFMRGSIRKAKPHPPQSRQRQGITLACHAQAQQHQVRDGEKGPHQGFVNHQHLQSGGA